MNMTKEKSWLFTILGVVAILFVTGAFKEFMDWKDDSSKYAAGGLTVGVGVAGSLIAHHFGWIDGHTRNLIIGASVASGATTALGDKAQGWGTQLAKKIRGKASGAKGPRGPVGQTGAAPEINFEQGEFNDDMLTSFTPPVQRQTQPRQQAQPPIPQQQPVQQVIHQPAPQQSSGNSTAQLIGSILGPLAQFGSAWIGSTAGPSVVNIGVPGSAGNEKNFRIGAFN